MAKKIKKTTKTPEQKDNISSAEETYVTPSSTKTYGKSSSNASTELLFSKQHLFIMGGGLVLVIIGFFLMSGGSMPDANTWDENIIYSFTRITLAPFIVLVGLIVIGYGIFYRTAADKAAAATMVQEEE